MKLWLLSQDENGGYDTYDSLVVRAETEEEARMVKPSYHEFGDRLSSTWASKPENVDVEYLGDVGEDCDEDVGIVIASFNAG